MNHLDINQIKEIIPHRHPFLLLDYIEDYVLTNSLGFGGHNAVLLLKRYEG